MAAPRIAVLLPCFNEAATVGTVVAAFRAALPDAQVYVFDNNSTDGTAAIAAAAGATVRPETRQGKGNVVRRMFADVEADVYVLADGDDTYDAAAAPAMIDKLLAEGLDMVTGVRISADAAAFRRGHRFGNATISGFIGALFRHAVGDALSGYRVLSRRFVKSFPALAGGFEIETELTVHALELAMPVAEIETAYRARPAGSASKLSTVRDGMRIVATIARLFKDERPLPCFSILFAILATGAIALALPLLETYAATGTVPRLPTAILATGTMLVAFLMLSIGLVLDTVTRGRRETKRLAYLRMDGPLGVRPAG